VCVAGLRRPFAGRPRGMVARVVLALTGVAVVGIVVSVVASPRGPLAVDGLRRLGLLGLALPLGASRLLDGRAGRWVAGAFVGAAVVNAVLALLEAFFGVRLFEVVSVTGRGATGALVGNEGQLSLVLVFAAVGTLAVLVTRPGSGGIAAVVVVLVAAIGACGNVTSVLALGAGSAVVLLRRFGALRVVPLAVAGAVGVALLPTATPLGTRVSGIAEDVREGRWDDVTSNRFGAWAAALEMIRARPLVGVGPGTYGAEFVPHRLAAEVRLRQRLTTRNVTSSYDHAHDEPLQAAAEWGVPAAVSASVAVLILVVAAGTRPDVEGLVLSGVLAAAAVAALTWFPFQQPSTMVPLLLALGRAWRRLG
jgi:O-antigen ligase